MLKIGKIITVVVLMLAVLAVQDLVINGPEEVMGSFFRELNSRSGYHTEPIPGEDLNSGEKSEILTWGSEDLNRIKIINSNGTVDLEGTSAGKATIAYKISVHAAEKEKAAAYAEKLDINSTISNGDLQLQLQEPRIREEGITSVRVDYVIKVPYHIFCDIRNSGGKVTAANYQGDIKINNNCEDTIIRNLQGSLEIDTHFSDLTISGIKGNIKLNTFGRSVYIADVEGDLFLSNHQSDVLIENVKGKITTEGSSGGSLELAFIEGSLNLLDNFIEDISIDTVKGTVIIKQQGSGSVELENIAGNITAATDRGNIRLETSGKGYEINAATSYQNYIRTRFPLEMEKLENVSNKARGIIGDGKYTANLESVNGNIYIRE